MVLKVMTAEVASLAEPRVENFKFFSLITSSPSRFRDCITRCLGRVSTGLSCCDRIRIMHIVLVMWAPRTSNKKVAVLCIVTE